MHRRPGLIERVVAADTQIMTPLIGVITRQPPPREISLPPSGKQSVAPGGGPAALGRSRTNGRRRPEEERAPRAAY